MGKLITFIIYNESANDSEERFIKNDLLKDNELEFIVNNDTYSENHHVKYIKAVKYDFFNKAKDISTGDYLCFISSLSYIEVTEVNKIKDILLSEKVQKKITVLTPYYINKKGKKIRYKNFPECKETIYETDRMIDLFLDSYLIPRDLAETVSFNESSKIDASSKFISDLMCIDNKIRVSENRIFTHDPFERQLTIYKNQTYEWWYKEDIDDFIIPLQKKNNQNVYIQHFIFYLLQIKYACNEGVNYKEVIVGDDVDIFIKKTKEILAKLDDDVILEPYYKILPGLAYINIVKMKYGSDRLNLSIKNDGNINYLYYNDRNKLFDISKEKIQVRVIDSDDGKLYIDGSIPNVNLLVEGAAFYFSTGNKKIKLDNTNVFSNTRFFGRTMYKDFTFSIEIPLDDIPQPCKIKFLYEYNDISQPMIMDFVGPFSKINKDKSSYWCFDKKMISYNRKTRSINYRKKKLRALFKRELIGLKKAHEFDRENGTEFFKLRLAYWFTFHKYNKKNIWIYYDKLTRGGDNADYMFRYAAKQNDNILHFYVLNEDSDDYKKMKKEFKNILVAGSLEQKLMVLHANIIVSTHAEPLRFLKFKKDFEKSYFRNLFNADVVFSYHGLVIPQLAANIRRVRANTKRFYCVSKYEIINLRQRAYGYEDNQLKLLGYPRFDGLINRDKKQILITPTWRRGLTKLKKINKQNITESVGFKDTEYYRIYNDLINDDKLHDAAEKNGYSIMFLLHSRLADFAHEFDNKHNIEITSVRLGGISYEDVLSESSLMLTDYTGVQFDFAYMRKPIVYLQPESLAPQYENGVFDYETMGFGPICNNVPDTIDVLINYINNNCENKKEYLDRVDDFYKYDDLNNCKRIYEDIIDFQKD